MATYVEDGYRDYTVTVGGGRPRASVDVYEFPTSLGVGERGKFRFKIRNAGDGYGVIAWRLCLMSGGPEMTVIVGGKEHVIERLHCLEVRKDASPGEEWTVEGYIKFDYTGVHVVRLAWGHYE